LTGSYESSGFLFNITLQLTIMKKALIIAVFAALLLGGCARGITIEQAANGKAKCGRTYIK
jgi:hypothetical protein